MPIGGRVASGDGPARRQVNAWIEGGIDGEAAVRLGSADGLWAACREAVRAGDGAYLDELSAAGVAAALDDELPASSGTTVQARVDAVLRLAQLDLAGPRAAPAPSRLLTDLEHVVAAFTPPAIGPWHAEGRSTVSPGPGHPRRDGVDLRSTVGDRLRRNGHPGLVVVDDLLRDLAGPQPAGLPSAEVRLPLASTGGARIAVVRLRTTDGTLGLHHDAVEAPLLRWDRAFEQSLQRAWWAAGLPAVAARWSLRWDDDETPVALVEGPSAGVAVALAAAHLADAERFPLDPRWICTGGIDSSGTTATLLAEDGTLPPAYRDKVLAAAGRTLVVPAVDADAVTAHAGRTGVVLEVRGVQQLDQLAGLDPVVDPADLDVPVPDAACPYKGLAFFTEDDAAWFHGRERVVAQPPPSG